MLRLTGTTKLQIVLSGAATTSRVTVSYMDFTATATTGGTQLSATNGVTPIDICDSPAALTTRQVDHISLLALAAMTATFSVHDGSARDLFKVTLATGDTFDWAHSGGARVLDANGQVKTGMPGYLPLTGGTLSGALVGAASQDVFNTVSTTVNAFGAASVALNIGHASAAAAFAGGISIPTGKDVTGAGTARVLGFASVAATTLTGTLSTAAQPNVTSVGTLTSLIVNGNTILNTTAAPAGGETAPIKSVGNLIAYNAAGVDATTNVWQNFIKTGTVAYSYGIKGTTSGNSKWTINSDTNGAGTDLFTVDRSGNGVFAGSLTAGAISGTTLALTGAVSLGAGAGAFQRTVTDSLLSLTGGTTVGTDPSIRMFGSTHATLANTAFYDSNTHTFRTANAGTTMMTLTSAGINGVLGGTTPAAATVTTLTASTAITALSGAYLQLNNAANNSAGTLTNTGASGASLITISVDTSVTGTLGVTGALSIGNTVGASVATPSTHKVTISIGGGTYYLLASNV